MTSWRFVERVTVRKVGDSFVGEARTHAVFATGEILSTPEAAMESAAVKLSADLEAKQMTHLAKQAKIKAKDEFEGLL